MSEEEHFLVEDRESMEWNEYFPKKHSVDFSNANNEKLIVCKNMFSHQQVIKF